MFCYTFRKSFSHFAEVFINAESHFKPNSEQLPEGMRRNEEGSRPPFNASPAGSRVHGLRWDGGTKSDGAPTLGALGPHGSMWMAAETFTAGFVLHNQHFHLD